MRTRSRPLMVLSLALLASAAILGGMLAYDGAVTELAAAQPGDTIHFQGELESIGAVGDLYVYSVIVDDDLQIIAESDAWIPEGTMVMDALVMERTDSLMRLEILNWREPVLEA